MEKLIVDCIGFKGSVRLPTLGNIIETVSNVSCELEFGNCYCFDSELTKGGWGLSWIIAGKIEQNDGIIKYNDNTLRKKERRFISQCIGIDVFDYPFYFNRTIRGQIENGLKKTKNKNADSLDQILKLFNIPVEKIDRNIENVSVLQYRASLAIGFAYNKKIFCFPWMDKDHLVTFKDLWLKDNLDFLRKNGYLIIIPTIYDNKLKDIFDNVIKPINILKK